MDGRQVYFLPAVHFSSKSLSPALFLGAGLNESPARGCYNEVVLQSRDDSIAFMEITAASVLDLNALNKLEHACFDKDAWPFLDLIAVLTFPDVVRLKVVQDGQMIGFVAGDMHGPEGIAWIATIGIAPEYRRRGIARELLRACEAKMNAPRIRLSVRASNDGAIRLYEQEGYQRVEVWQGYYNDGEAAIVMEKKRAI